MRRICRFWFQPSIIRLYGQAGYRQIGKRQMRVNQEVVYATPMTIKYIKTKISNIYQFEGLKKWR